MSRMAARGMPPGLPLVVLAQRLPLARERGGAQPRERLADQARDLHLRDADARADLGLREVLGEAQPEHLALARGDRGHQPLQRRAVLCEAEPDLEVPVGVAEAVARV